MQVSVIIATYNGANKIEASLSALHNQTFRNFEVILIDDGSTDATVEIARKFERKFPKLIVHSTPNAGRASAKNTGASLASGNLLIFIDDDIRLFEDAIETHLKYHTETQDKIVFGHLELEASKARQCDFLNYRRTVESSWRKHQDVRISLKNYGITSANLSLMRKVFVQVGEFDSELRDSEDFDFGIRALLMGIEIHYNPEIRGFHDDFSSLFQYVKRQNQYLKSKYLLLQKHPEYLDLLPNQFKWVKPLPGDRIKKLIFKKESLWDFLFSSRVFALCPQQIRYKLYSGYIYVHSVMSNRSSASTLLNKLAY